MQKRAPSGFWVPHAAQLMVEITRANLQHYVTQVTFHGSRPESP